MMMTKEDWVRRLGLEPHVEGGYFKQTEKASERLDFSGKERALYTSIYFLLEETNLSHFHRLTADEIWYFHAGEALTVHMITPDGHYEAVTLGLDLSKGQRLHYCVPKGTIFGSTVEKDYALVSCLVVPGFEFDDFELFKRADLLAAYPEHQAIIERLTRD
ncbi:cupin domain-containing protein [Streptococcus dysgalactiae]|uniref:cupin domain-containing protein n=1 Tax=Streptococcus dysgalactiae TaxID=1334 RepID=UPI000219D1C5|nr:cupin domain-containing protein [Streptococcus dysgalactiae]EGR88386.1 cupin family protein [Streptococcus dysgalactiae subsp. equisimilis SK1250]KKC23083.1 cupin [Streptococcus dysgalactiae subsp. equisimilis]MBM6514646.1 cupin domain-containing protein [Streptococcus dysgalactiae subsp. equisimilis]MBM6534456.1 cupin domain-containing protein [Streptococcus dysgalactiae subsp. equisimilis]OBZ06899.1 cupin [Streptococcus dysgalactiae subsp. equisimilis]